MAQIFLDVVLQLQTEFLDYMVSATTLLWDGGKSTDTSYREATKESERKAWGIW